MVSFYYQTLKEISNNIRRRMSGKYKRIHPNNLTVNTVYQDFPMGNDLAFFSKYDRFFSIAISNLCNT